MLPKKREGERALTQLGKETAEIQPLMNSITG